MMSNGRCAYCPRCGAQLRRDQPLGAVCDPCASTGPPPLPLEFFGPQMVQSALLGYEFGWFFRRVRAFRDWSQRELGDVIDLSQNRVSAIEGGRALYDIRIIVRLHQRLGVPAPLLGFGDPATVFGGPCSGGPPSRGRAVGWTAETSDSTSRLWSWACPARPGWTWSG